MVPSVVPAEDADVERVVPVVRVVADVERAVVVADVDVVRDAARDVAVRHAEVLLAAVLQELLVAAQPQTSPTLRTSLALEHRRGCLTRYMTATYKPQQHKMYPGLIERDHWRIMDGIEHNSICTIVVS